MIRYALEELGLSEKEFGQVLMVGDRENDIEGARRNGLDSMGVLYGYGDLQELQTAGADYIAESTRDVSEMILNH